MRREPDFGLSKPACDEILSRGPRSRGGNVPAMGLGSSWTQASARSTRSTRSSRSRNNMAQITDDDNGKVKSYVPAGTAG